MDLFNKPNAKLPKIKRMRMLMPKFRMAYF